MGDVKMRHPRHWKRYQDLDPGTRMVPHAPNHHDFSFRQPYP